MILILSDSQEDAPKDWVALLRCTFQRMGSFISPRRFKVGEKSRKASCLGQPKRLLGSPTVSREGLYHSWRVLVLKLSEE